MKRKINNNLLIAAFACGLVFLFGAWQTAAAQSIPPGSYQQSCQDIKFVGTTLSAWCKGKYNEGDFQLGRTEIQQAHLCGGIDNIQGELVCTNNFGSKAYKIAKASFNTAAMKIIGRKPEGGENAGEILSWIYLMLTKYGSAQNYFAGMKVEAAEYVLKALIAESKNAKFRKEIIDRAFYQATGASSNTTQFAFWDAKNPTKEAWFASILESVGQEMNKNAGSRKLMIQTAYVTAFGRMPTDADLSYWQPRTENFKQLVEASRTWLYSPNGAGDLAATVASVLQFNLKRKPTEDEVKSAIGDYQKKRLIFMEMRGAMSPIYY